MQLRTPLRYLVIESLLIIVFVYFLLFANTWRAYADYGLIRNGVILLLAASGLWLVLILAKRWQTPSPLSFTLLLFLGVYTLAAVTSIQPARSFDEIWAFSMYVFGFAFVVQLVANGWPAELFTKSLLISGSILMGISLALTLAWYRQWLAASGGQLIPDIAYRLPLANGQATYLYLSLFVVTARWIATPARLPRIFMAVWVIPALFLLFLTASRGGWLATGVGLSVIGFIYVRDAGGMKIVGRVLNYIQRHRMLSLGLAAIGVLVLAGLIWIGSQQLINPQKGPALDARVEFWGPVWNVFQLKPILGQGPLTYGSAYLRYNSVPPHGFFAHAHNTTLNLLVESGLLGVGAFGVLAVATVLAIWQRVNTTSGQDRAVAIAALAGTIAWAAHSLVDTVQVEPMNSLMLAVLLGAALGTGAKANLPEQAGWSFKLRIAWPVVLGFVLGLSGLFNLWRLLPLVQGVDSAQHTNWQKASAEFAEAVARLPGSVIANQQLGLVDSVLASQGQVDRLTAATTEYETVVQLDPDWWLNHANLAALYGANGQTDKALAEYKAALKVGAGSPMLQLNYGLASEQAGNLTEARQAYGQVLTLRRDLTAAYFWRATVFRQEVVSEWLTENPAKPELTLDEMETQAQGGDTAQAYLPLAAAYLQTGRLTEAERLLQKANLAYFDSGDSQIEYSWLSAELMAGKGNLLGAIAKGQAAVDGYLNQSAFGPGTFGQAAYAEVFFREESMAIDLTPQLNPLPITDTWADRWVQVGEWQAQNGDLAGAQQTYRKVLLLVPDNVAALANVK